MSCDSSQAAAKYMKVTVCQAVSGQSRDFQSQLAASRAAATLSCKHETAEDHATLLQAIVDTTNDNQKLTRLRVVSLASDGESRCGKALAKLTYVAPLAPSSPIYDQLVHLNLMDYFVGPDNITADKDYKHVFKRLRNTILRENGSLICGVHIMRAVIRKHLKDSGFTDTHINHVLDPTDKQDVMLAYSLLKDLWSLPMANPVSSTPTYIKARDTLRIYGALLYHLIFPYICVELSLSEQLEHLSVAMHLTLALYVLDGAWSHFIPTSLFVDIGIMVKNVFFCVAKAKVNHPNDPFFLVLLGTDRLEALFGILRTMVGNDTNLDVLQLALRITSTTEVSTILAKHPEWDRSPHRLCLPTVSKNSVEVSNSLDHIGPRAYLHPDDLRPSSLTLATPWKRGRLFIEDRHPWITPTLRSIASTNNASILAPYGISLVGSSLIGGINDITKEEDTPSYESPQLDRPMRPSEVPDATLGMQELEDAVAENQWRNSDAYGQDTVTFSHSVQIGGITIRKSCAIAQQFRYVTSANSTDRLRCVAQESQFKSSGSLAVPCTQAGDAHVDGPSLFILQPIATVVVCEGKPFLCIAEVNGLFLENKPVDDMPISVLSDKAAQVSYQRLHLVQASDSDDHDGKHDWRSLDLFRLSAKVPSAFVLPINPDVASHKLCDAFFLFQSSELIAFATSLRDSIRHSYRKVIPQVEPSECFPYREQDGESS